MFQEDGRTALLDRGGPGGFDEYAAEFERLRGIARAALDSLQAQPSSERAQAAQRAVAEMESNWRQIQLQHRLELSGVQRGRRWDDWAGGWDEEVKTMRSQLESEVQALNRRALFTPSSSSSSAVSAAAERSSAAAATEMMDRSSAKLTEAKRLALESEEDTKVLGHKKPTWTSLHSVIDLCSGFGGLSQGLLAAGFEIAVAVDQNSRMVDLHSKVCEAHHICGDFGDKSVLHEIWSTSGGASVLTSGFSCQPYSALGDGGSRHDTRSNCLTKTLQAGYYLQVRIIGLECVAPAAKDAFVKSEIDRFLKCTGFHCTCVELKMDHIWPCRRHRAWWLLTAPEIGPIELQTWQVLTNVCLVEHVIPSICLWSEEDENELALDDDEMEAFGVTVDQHGKYLLNAKGVAPCALHGWGAQIRACPCGCRKYPFSKARLESKGLHGCLVRSAAPKDGSSRIRHIHPNECMGLNTMDPVLDFGPNTRLTLTAAGQIACPAQALWIFSHVASRLETMQFGESKFDADAQIQAYRAWLLMRCRLVWPCADETIQDPKLLAMMQFWHSQSDLSLAELMYPPKWQDQVNQAITVASVLDHLIRKQSQTIPATVIDLEGGNEAEVPQWMDFPGISNDTTTVGCMCVDSCSVVFDGTGDSPIKFQPKCDSTIAQFIEAHEKLVGSLHIDRVSLNGRDIPMDHIMEVGQVIVVHLCPTEDPMPDSPVPFAAEVVRPIQVLDPLLITSWTQQCGLDLKSWALEHKDIHSNGTGVITAVLLDRHWVPVFLAPNKQSLHVHTWDAADACHARLNQKLEELAQALGFEHVLVQRQQRLFFTSSLCGTLAIAFLRSMLIGNQLPTSHDEAEYIHQVLKENFASALRASDIATRPWIWGAGDRIISLSNSLPPAQTAPYTLTREQRIDLFTQRGLAMGDDELRYHILKMILHQHDHPRTTARHFVFFEPLMFTCWETTGPALARLWCAQNSQILTHGHNVISAFCIDNHWMPIWIVPAGLTLQLHTFLDARIDERRLDNLMATITHTLGFREFAVHRVPTSLPEHTLCGVHALTFIAHVIMQRPLPRDVRELRDLHTDIRASFVAHLYDSEQIPMPVVWGNGPLDHDEVPPFANSCCALDPCGESPLELFACTEWCHCATQPPVSEVDLQVRRETRLQHTVTHAMSDDEVLFHLEHILQCYRNVPQSSSQPKRNFVVLPPLHVHELMRGNVMPLTQWIEQTIHTYDGHCPHVLTAMFSDHHWIPVWLPPPAPVFQVHTLNDARARSEVMTLQFGQLAQAFGHAEHVVHYVPIAPFDHKLCGAMTVSFIAHIVLRTPLPNQELQLRHRSWNMKQKFVDHVGGHQGNAGYSLECLMVAV
eukprot:s83_g40.t1